MSRALLCLLVGITGCLPTLPRLGDPCGAFPEPGLYKLPVSDPEGRSRDPFVYIPAGEGPRDLVFMLHGAGQEPQDMVRVSGWSDLADQEGFAVVYPGGVGNLWNAAENPYTDANDVGYLDAVAAEATARMCGDRVLALGFSNGAAMVHTWGCQSDVPDAIVPTQGAYLIDRCPDAPIATRVYHGTADTTVPYEGDDRDGFLVPGVAEFTGIRVEQNACAPEPVDTERAGDSRCEIYACEESLVVCTIEDWTHAYPGGENTNGREFDATTESWEWFDGLPRDTTE